MVDRPLACPEWQEDIAGWLIAQLPPEREAALQEHLTTCSACHGESDSLLAVVAVALTADPHGGPFGPEVLEPASAELGNRIVAQVAAERRAGRRVRASLALVGVTALALSVVVVTRPDSPPPLHGEPVSFVVEPVGVEADAVVAADGTGSLIELTATGLDPDITYALWLTPPGGGYSKRVAAGTFRPDERGRVDERLHSALPAKEMGRVWVTDPEGDITLDTDRS